MLMIKDTAATSEVTDMVQTRPISGAEVRSTVLPSMLAVPRYLHLPPASSGHKCTVSQFGTMTKSDKVEIDIVPISKKACVHEQALPRSARTDTKSLPSSKNIKKGARLHTLDWVLCMVYVV